MTTTRTRTLALALALAATLTGCATSGVYADTTIPTPTPTETSAAPSPAATTPAPCDDPLASYAPTDPADIPAGSTMAAIRERGRLIVGVSADSLLLGARNPITGQVEGFDIDMARLVADAIFDDPDRVELKVITAAQRIPFLEDGTVDLVSRAMSITCDRWTQIAFSAEYLTSGQKVLVPLASEATSIDDLAGAKVCAPAGTSSLAKLADYPEITPVAGTTHSDCLVQFQQGDVDAITGDDTVLAGLAAQDPYAKVVGEAFTAENYGLGIKAEAVDLVQFVNAVLEQAKADGTWAASYDRWLAAALGPATAPSPVYGR